MSVDTNIPEGWVETTLGEICDITSAKRIFAKEYQTTGIPFFRGKEVSEKFKGNSISTELFISEEKYNEIKQKYGVPIAEDILLTSVGTLGNPYLVEKDYKFYFKDGNLTWFRNFNNINSKFLFYWIISSQGKENLSHAKIGSTQQAYTMTLLKKVSILCPPFNEQKAIAQILTSFDDKIELLQAQNKTLETTAQTIFKEWFGKESYDSETVRLGDIITIKGGYSYKGKEIGKGTSLLLGMGCVSYNQRFLTKGARLYSDSAPESFLVKPGEIVLATRQQSENLPILGFPAIIPEEFRGKKVIVGTNLYMVFNNSLLNNETLFSIFRSKAYRNHILNNSKGTTVKMITKDSVESFEFIMPPKKIIEHYQKTVNPLIDKLKSNYIEIQTLKKTRNTILPKLMSGSLRVDLSALPGKQAGDKAEEFKK